MAPRRSFKLPVRTGLIIFFNPSVNDTVLLPSLWWLPFISLWPCWMQGPPRTAWSGGQPRAGDHAHLVSYLSSPYISTASLWNGWLGGVEAKLTCRKVLQQNQHHSVVHTLGTWGSRSLTLKSPQHGVLCVGWGQIYHSSLLSVPWIRRSGCRLLKKDALFQITSDTCVARGETNVQLANRVCRILWYLWDKVLGWVFT